MKLIDIKPNLTPLWSEVWSIYCSSFPEYERRGEKSHMDASCNEHFITKIAVDHDNNLLAILFYWKIENNIYIEHLAVNPESRGNNIGTRVMQTLIEQSVDCNIILEIEPPVDEMTIKRLTFYQRLKFQENPYEYTHPSYAKEPFIHRLDLLSYPNKLSQEEYDNFCNFVSETILLYIE